MSATSAPATPATTPSTTKPVDPHAGLPVVSPELFAASVQDIKDGRPSTMRGNSPGSVGACIYEVDGFPTCANMTQAQCDLIPSSHFIAGRRCAGGS